MGAIEITSTVKIDHAELGAEVWEWDSEQQAAFLASLAKTFSANGGKSHFQVHYIVDELRKTPADINAVRWLNDLLTDYLKEEA
jgi:hypothetical protein